MEPIGCIKEFQILAQIKIAGKCEHFFVIFTILQKMEKPIEESTCEYIRLKPDPLSQGTHIVSKSESPTRVEMCHLFGDEDKWVISNKDDQALHCFQCSSDELYHDAHAFYCEMTDDLLCEECCGKEWRRNETVQHNGHDYVCVVTYH